jgi:hypothetical protein
MNTKYSTSGNNTWIVDVMDNDTVITSAEADSEENAMAMARTSVSAFYGSRAAMFEYAVYPPPARATKSKATNTAAKGLHAEPNGQRSAPEELKERGRRESSGAPDAREHYGGIQDPVNGDPGNGSNRRTSGVYAASVAFKNCHNGRNEVRFSYGCSCENESDLL